MARFVRIGRFIINLDLAGKETGPGESFDLDPDETREFLRQLGPVPAWRPVVIGAHPRGPLTLDRCRSWYTGP